MTLLLVLLASIVAHEFAHCLVAAAEGDPTGTVAGRLSWNPLVHLTPVGSILVPLLLLTTTGLVYGWGKPAPINLAQLRHRALGAITVFAAGPAANLTLAALAWATSLVWAPARTVAEVNLILGLFNLLPFPGLDGGRIASILHYRRRRATG